MKQYSIKMRARTMINTDPQRRCYNGCNFSEEMGWTAWGEIDCIVQEDALARRLEFWKELNDGAVEARGEGARREFKAEEIEHVH